MAVFMSVPAMAEELQTKPETLREWARRKDDPFPIFVPPWRTRNGVVDVELAVEWFRRNSRPYGRSE